MNPFAKALQHKIKNSKLTQGSASLLCGVCKSQFSKYYHGKVLPNANIFCQISLSLDLDINKIMLEFNKKE